MRSHALGASTAGARLAPCDHACQRRLSAPRLQPKGNTAIITSEDGATALTPTDKQVRAAAVLRVARQSPAPICHQRCTPPPHHPPTRGCRFWP